MFTAAILSVVTATAAASLAAAPAAIAATPDRIAVTTFFDGIDLQVTGTAPSGLRLAALLTGAPRTLELKTKGKVWGVLWMNVGEVDFDTVPGVYLLATGGAVCELASFEVRKSRGIGVDVLWAQSESVRDDRTRRLFGELVKLKEREHLFGSFERALETRPGGPGEVSFSTRLPLPARIPEGAYELALWGFDGDDGAALATTEITVADEGLTQDVAALAREHGLLYGVLALLIALVVGLATGFVFGLAGKGGH